MPGPSTLRSYTSAPFICAVAGGVLTLGTVVGQSSEAQLGLEGPSSMAGMDHSGGAGGMDHSAHMPGGGQSAPEPAGEDTAGMDHSGMDGMDHSGMDGMDHSAGAAPAGGAMDMSDPGMAARMPGGFHAECASARVCTVMFAPDADGVASVLGVRASLTRLAATTARLEVNGKSVLVRQNKAVRAHGIAMRITSIDAQHVSVRFAKAR